jgi:hypothetical protein
MEIMMEQNSVTQQLQSLGMPAELYAQVAKFLPSTAGGQGATIGEVGNVNPNLNPNSMWGKMGGLEGLGNAAGIVGDLGGVYTALKGLGLAKDQLNFNKSSYNTNLANQTKTYNTELEGRTQAQYFTEGKTTAQADAYVKKNSL